MSHIYSFNQIKIQCCQKIKASAIDTIKLELNYLHSDHYHGSEIYYVMYINFQFIF